MNPLTNNFKPNPTKRLTIQTNQLTTAEEKIFQDMLHEWSNTPTLDLLLENWSKYRDKTLSMMNIQQNIPFLLLNVSSLNRYMVDIFNLIDSTAPSIIILNGTYHDEASVKRFTSHFFNFHVYARKGSNRFGGVLVAVHKSIPSRRVDKFNHLLNLIVLEIGTGSESFQLITCYSPPTEQIPLDIFNQIVQINPNSIFTGDFNAKHSSWSLSSENHKGQSLFKWLSSLHTQASLEIINKFIPTSTRSNATIDLILAPAHMLSASFSVLPSIGNDHHPILWQPPFKLSSTHLQYPIKRTRWKLLEIFLTFTGTYWQSLFTSMTDTAAFFTLYERFLSLCASRLTSVTLRDSIKPSLPQHLVNMIDRKRHCLKIFRHTRHPYFAIALRDISKSIRKELFSYKRSSWLSYCNSLNDCNTNMFWRKAKRHFNPGAAAIDGFITNNNTTTSPSEMCTIARNFYEEQFSNHQLTGTEIETEANNLDTEIAEILKNNPPAPIDITYRDLRQSIASLKSKNSSGVDGVSNRILKLLPPNHLSFILQCLKNFAATLETPSHWHVAKMILLSKTKSKVVTIEETRPISLLPCFSKLFEKCFLIHFRRWIKEQGLLPAEQTGFRPGHNMAVRLIAIVDQIGQSLSMNTAAAALFVDFRTAFNQLWFNGLWLKLTRLHCPIQQIAWLRHYLNGRKAYINIKNSTSTMFNLSKGVPQGSCIGPVLFITYHHDMLEALSTIHWKHLFADDLSILFAPSSALSPSIMMCTLTDQIKEVLGRLIKYSNKWKQPINFSKTNWTLFHRQVDPKIPDVNYEGYKIVQVKKFKYLGTILDAKLSFTPHIDYIEAKIRTNLNIFRRLASSRMTSEQVNYRLYNAYIRPYYQSLLNFHPILSPSKQNKLEGLNRKIFRTIHRWFDARNVEIENLPKYQSITKLTKMHWDKLIVTILNTNPSIIEDFLQHKLSIVFLQEYLSNPALSQERKQIFERGKIRKNVRKLLSEQHLSLLDHTLCYR